MKITLMIISVLLLTISCTHQNAQKEFSKSQLEHNLHEEKGVMQYHDKLVNIGNRNLFAQVSGNGPVVVLCSGGLGGGGAGIWGAIKPSISKFATVVSYDRAGGGRSDPPSAPQTLADMVLDLHALLTALNLDKPAVLVGTSFGGLLVQLYACKYPTEVTGLVLLDPTSYHGTKLDLNREFTLKDPDPSGLDLSGLDPRRRKLVEEGKLDLMGTVRRMAVSFEQVRSAIEDKKLMPDIPIVVISAGDRSELGQYAQQIGEFAAQENQRIARQVAQGRYIVAEKSQHGNMLLTEPDLIIETVKSVVMAEGN